VVLWPHLSAFLIAAIKVPGPRFSPPLPPDTGKSCLRRCTFWLRVVGGLKAHRFGSPRRESGSQPNRNGQRMGSVGTSSIREQKKGDRFSPEKARTLIYRLSYHSPPPRPPVASLISKSLFRIDRLFSISFSSFFLSFSLLVLYLQQR